MVDASVALKWMFRSRDDESGVEAARALLRGVLYDRIVLVQPPHFIAEVGAVLAREAPGDAVAALGDLLDIEMEIVGDEQVYRRAMALSAGLEHHLFDTLYHAVALEDERAVLVTADERYERKAQRLGRIVRLRDFNLPAEISNRGPASGEPRRRS